MIVVKLIGGLGNQLFQYAIGRQISLYHEVKLKVDIGDLLDRTPRKNFTFRDFELEHFNCKIETITRTERLFFKWIHWLLSKMGLTNFYWKETNFNFDDRFLSSSHKSMYLEGFWQSERYFSSIRPILLNDLKIIKGLSEFTQLWELRIKKSTSISVHIRRGDYLYNISANEFHGICSLEYYYNCIKIMKAKFTNCSFFFFSDDIEWVKIKFSNLENAHFITSNNNKEDLYLMSLCKHNIIANSSFSWWGAWLNTNENKLVFAPKKWFNDDSIDTSDLIPNSWERI
jgi:hypothetical protein